MLNNFNLSEQQLKIVEAVENNILVIACPGSGKTHTLIARYINMLSNHNLKPEETIMITFTKKAGVEMLNRLNKVIPDKIPYHVGTIHGLSYKILKEYNKLKNIIMDDQDVKELLNDIIEKQNLNNDIIKSKIHQIIDQSSISYPPNLKDVLIKNNLEKYYKDFNLIYKLYQQRKKKENLIDFNDLMIVLNNFLLDNKSNEFKNKIKCIFFDEYQDVNYIQNNILLNLSKYSKVMVVGDDAQSIYSFRGSSVKYILNYNPNTLHKVYLLEENYRSSLPIIDFCQDIISHNLNQINKNVKSINNDTYKPRVNCFNNSKEQYEWVTNDILNKINKGIKLSNISILARKNNLLNDIELYLISKKIPVSKHLGLSLLNKSHIKDFIAFIIIIINPKSSIHFKRIIELHQEYKIELSELDNIILQIKKIKSDTDKMKLIINYLEKIWDSIEYKNDINYLIKFFNNLSLEDFINNINLNDETNLEDTIYLSTIHGAKGLEWKYVYIIDMNSKDFPLTRPKFYLDELEEIDEERRLFYVACSRAKEKLYLTFHNNMSPLLREINPLLYNSNISNNDFKINPTLNILIDIRNHLNFIGYFNIYKSLKNIIIIQSIINKKIIIPNNLNIKIVNKVIKQFILKIIQIKYLDKNNNLENVIETLSISDINYKTFLINNNLNLIKGICKIINKINPNKIIINHNTTYKNINACIDIICDNHMIIIGFNMYCETICEKLLYSYILKKNNMDMTNIIFYNPINGEEYNLNITNIDLINYKKIFY